MKATTFLPLTSMFGALLFASCMDSGDATDKTTDQMRENTKEMNEAKTESNDEWRAERTEAAKELRELRSTLEDQRMREQERLPDLKNAEKKAECQAMINELNTNIARIDASLAGMEASTGTDWSSVKDEARRTTDETRTWWERQKEKIDQRTDADKDKDGH